MSAYNKLGYEPDFFPPSYTASIHQVNLKYTSVPLVFAGLGLSAPVKLMN